METIQWVGMAAAEMEARLLAIRKKHAALTWELGMGLREMARSGAFQELGFLSVTAYAMKRLDVHPQKCRELLRACEVLQRAPAMNHAFRCGELNWSRVRELTRRLNHDNDAELTAWGRLHTSREISDAFTMSPREFKKQEEAQAQGAAATSQDLKTTTQDSLELFPSDESAHAVEPQMNATPGEIPSVSQKPCDAAPAPVSQEPCGGVPAVGNAEARTGAVDAPPGAVARTITVTFHLSADVYALYEQAASKVMAGKGKRVGREAVMQELCTRYLSTGSAQSNVKHQVHVHVQAETGEAWYETDLGRMPAANPVGTPEPSLISRLAIDTQSDDEQGPAAPQEVPATNSVAESNGASEENANGVKVASRYVSMATIREVYARAAGRCEDCGATSLLEMDHVTPLSERPHATADDFRLRCKDCHSGRHLRDFENLGGWRWSRNSAVFAGELKRAGFATDEVVLALS